MDFSRKNISGEDHIFDDSESIKDIKNDFKIDENIYEIKLL